MQPRYFIGISLPADLSQTIAAVQKDLFVPGKVMAPLVPHITLLPPGVLDTLSPLYFVPKVSEVAKGYLTFNIQLTEMAMFDKRVLYVTVESPGIKLLHEALVDLLPDKVRSQYLVGRDFVPHLTLAQAKPKQDLANELIAAVKTKIEPILPYTFTVAELTTFTQQQPRTYDVSTI